MCQLPDLFGDKVERFLRRFQWKHAFIVQSNYSGRYLNDDLASSISFSPVLALILPWVIIQIAISTQKKKKELFSSSV